MSGRPRLVVVRGPAGIGKSALVEEFVVALRRAGAGRVLRAGASEIETGLAFGVATQLLEPDPAGPAPGGRDPVAVGAELVQQWGAGGAVAVVVEDVHWADRSSLAALFFASRRLRADSVLVVLTCREGGDGAVPALVPALDRLVEAVGGRVLALRGLDAAAVADLVRARGGPEVGRAAVQRLTDHTAGNPLHLRVLLDEYPEVVADAAHAGVPLPVPESFAALVGVRLDGCRAPTRDVLRAAAVLGPASGVTTVAAVAGVGADVVVGAVEEGVAASLLRPPSGRLRAVAFTHPLVRAALYHDLGLGARRSLHRRAATVLASSGTGRDLEVLRHEVAASAGTDEGLGDRVEAAADRAAGTGAWAESATALLVARDLTDRPAVAARRLVAAVARRVAAGDVTEAVALRPAVAAMDDGPARDYLLGLLGLFRGVRAEAEALLVRAWRGAGDDRELAGTAAAQVASIVINDGRGEETVLWARRALDLGGGGLLDARVMLMLALGCLERSTEALAEVAHVPAAPALVGAGDADALLGRGVLRLWRDELDLARPDLAAAADLFAARGPLHMRIIALYYLVDAEYRLGRWDDAAAHGLFAATLADDAEQAWTAPLVHGMAAVPFAGRGAWDVAERHARIASEAAEAQDNPAGRLWAAVAAARVAQARADPAALVRATDGVAGMVGADGWRQPGVQPWEHLRVEGLVGLGRLDEARRDLGDLERVVRAQDHDAAVLATTRVRARLEAASGDLEVAERTCTAVADRAATGTRPFEAALLRATHGALVRRAGRRREATALLEAARHGFAALGAAPFLLRCDRELAACGRTVTARQDAATTLSPQERAVATLVASGATNREVAAELVVSVKTVEYHLGHAFTKLGVRTRTALAARLAAGAPAARDAVP